MKIALLKAACGPLLFLFKKKDDVLKFQFAVSEIVYEACDGMWRYPKYFTSYTEIKLNGTPYNTSRTINSQLPPLSILVLSPVN